jgi:hypothetical protein
VNQERAVGRLKQQILRAAGADLDGATSQFLDALGDGPAKPMVPHDDLRDAAMEKMGQDAA